MLVQLTGGHQVQLLERGEAFFPALIAAIDASVAEVRLETYTFHFDASGEPVAHALLRAAQRGVAVYLVVDGIGTPDIPALWAEQFAAAGVKWYVYSPLDRLGVLIPTRWRRLHRKLCVVDAQTAFCGGINIQDDLVDLNHGVQETPRMDFAVQVTGPLVADTHRALVQLWNRLDAKRQFKRLRWEGAGEALLESVAAPPSVLGGPATTGTPRKTGVLAALVLRDNLRNRTRIERTYRKALAAAHKEVLIANAYFLPGRKLRRALILAARRGVRVRLLLQGRYEYFMQYHASRPVYGALLEAGVEIYEYGHGFLHAKVAVIDGHWATVGSSNLEPLSLLLAREANVVVQDAAFAQMLQARLEAAIDSHGKLLERKTYANRPLRQRFLDSMAYGLVRLSLFLLGRRY